MSQTSRDRVNSRHVRTHEKNSGETVRRLGTIIQSIFCAQSGASIHLTVWKWSGESRYPGALPPVLENFRRAFSPGQTDCPWASEDAYLPSKTSNFCFVFCLLNMLYHFFALRYHTKNVTLGSSHAIAPECLFEIPWMKPV